MATGSVAKVKRSKRMNKRSTSVQLLRVSACFLVFLVHFGQRAGFSGALLSLSNFGAYGVQLFLLISGYLAGKTFIDNPDTSVLIYYKKRAISLLPLYYLVILYYFITENILNQIVSVIPNDELGIGWLRYIFLLNGFLNSDTYFWSNLGITWTIPIFAFFYLIAPWILRKIKSKYSSIIIWFVIFVLTQVLNCFYSCVIFNELHWMFLGVVIYTCVKYRYTSIATVVISIITIGVTILGSPTYVYGGIFSCIMLALLGTDDLALPEWLQRIIDVLDKYSYTIYLMHGVVFCSLINRLVSLGTNKIIIVIVAILGTFLATFIVGKFIEKPIQRFLKKKLIKE